jgi:hypothetical protein
VLVAALVVLGQSGTSVRGAYNVLIEIMVVTSMLPLLLLCGAAIRFSSGALVTGESRIWGGGNLRARRQSVTVRSYAVE